MSASAAAMDEVVVLLNNWEPRLPIMQVTQSVQLLQCSLAALDTQCRLAHITAACRHSIISAFCSSLTLFYNPHFKLGWNENQENEFSATWKSLCSCMKLVLECPADTVPPKELSVSKVQAIQVLQRCSNGRLHEDGWDLECHAAPLLAVLTALLTSRPTSKSVFHACNGIQYLVRWLHRLAVMSFLIVTDDLKCNIINLLAAAIDCDEGGTDTALDAKAIPILLRFVANQADQVLFSTMNFFKIAIHASFEKTRKQFLIADGVNAISKLQSQTECDELKLGLNDLWNAINGEESLISAPQIPDKIAAASIQPTILTADYVENEPFIENHAKQNINLFTVSEADDKKSTSLVSCNSKQSTEYDSVMSQQKSELIPVGMGPNITEANSYHEHGKYKDNLICSNSNENSDMVTHSGSNSHTSINSLSIKRGYYKKRIQLPKIIKPLKYRQTKFEMFNNGTKARKISSMIHGKLNSMSESSINQSGESLMKKLFSNNRCNLRNSNFNEEAGHNSMTYTSLVHENNCPRTEPTISHHHSHFESGLLASNVCSFDGIEVKKIRCNAQNNNFNEETRHKTIDYMGSTEESTSPISGATMYLHHESRLCDHVVCQNVPENNKLLNVVGKEGSSKQTPVYLGNNLPNLVKRSIANHFDSTDLEPCNITMHDQSNCSIASHSETSFSNKERILPLKRNDDFYINKYELEDRFSTSGRKPIGIHSSTPLKKSFKRDYDSSFHKFELGNGFPINGSKHNEIHSNTYLKNRELEQLFHSGTIIAPQNSHSGSFHTSIKALSIKPGYCGDEIQLQNIKPLTSRQIMFQRFNSITKAKKINSIVHGKLYLISDSNVDLSGESLMRKLCDNSHSGSWGNEQPARLSMLQLGDESCLDGFQNELQRGAVIAHSSIGYVEFSENLVIARNNQLPNMKCIRSSSIDPFKNNIFEINCTSSTNVNKSKSIIKTCSDVNRVKFEPKTIHAERPFEKISDLSNKILRHHAMKTRNSESKKIVDELSSDSDDGVPNEAKSINQTRIPSNIHLGDDRIQSGAKSINKMVIAPIVDLSSDSDEAVPNGAKITNRMRNLSSIYLSSDSDDGIPNGAKRINQMCIPSNIHISSDSDDRILNGAKSVNQMVIAPIADLSSDSDNGVPNGAKSINRMRNKQSIQYSLQ